MDSCSVSLFSILTIFSLSYEFSSKLYILLVSFFTYLIFWPMVYSLLTLLMMLALLLVDRLERWLVTLVLRLALDLFLRPSTHVSISETNSSSWSMSFEFSFAMAAVSSSGSIGSLTTHFLGWTTGLAFGLWDDSHSGDSLTAVKSNAYGLVKSFYLVCGLDFCVACFEVSIVGFEAQPLLNPSSE